MSNYILKGIGGRRNRKEELKRMIEIEKFMRGKKVEIIKPRKERARETTSREQPERELRNQVIKELRKRGVKVYRIENSIGGKSTGIADLLVFNINKNKSGFIELKASSIILRQDNQREFRENCLRCGINHWVVCSVSEAVEAIA